VRPRSCISLVFFCAIFAVDLLGQGGSAEVRDSTVQDEALRYSDAVAFKTWTTGSEVFFEVEMSKPHIEGMYTCLHVYLDADANPRTGIEGAEIWLRASVGSRYHPMSFKPKKGKAAKDIQRASLSRVVKGRADEGRGGGKTWLHTTVLPKPEIETKKIRFKVSTSVLRSAGARYGSVTGVMAEVETTCTDQPLMLRHVCNDEGVNITLDGRDGDWSHPQIARDPGGELHKVGQILDLTSLRAEHDSDYLYACVQLAEEGLRKDSMNTSDVSRFDGVTFYIEPLFPRYQSPKKLFIRYGRGGHPTSPRDVLRSRYFGMRNPGGWRGSVSGKTVEIRANRASGQNDFRVWAWSDLRRVDRVPDEGWMKIDWGKPK
jgi:hypothetical protein